mgnify:CR=1 FL=1
MMLIYHTTINHSFYTHHSITFILYAKALAPKHVVGFKQGIAQYIVLLYLFLNNNYTLVSITNPISLYKEILYFTFTYERSIITL